MRRYVQAPVDEGGGAVLVLVDVRAVATMNDERGGAVQVLVTVDESGGAGQDHNEEGA